LGSALGLLLRIFAYLYELVLSLFLIGLGIVALAGGQHNLRLAMLPWEGADLTRNILILGVAGLVCVLLAGGRMRWIFPLWCLFVLVMMFRGFFASSYSFEDASHFRFAVAITTGALLALVGSLSVLRARRRR
jgi:hypothetical protein